MTAVLVEAARALADILLPLMRGRLERFGVDGSGAFRFYETRLATGNVFSRCELMVAETIGRGLQVEDIHEIGCGWGQLVFLLAWSGQRATGFELDGKRFVGASDFLAELRQLDP